MKPVVCLFVAVFAVSVTFASAGCSSSQAESPVQTAKIDPVARGEYLVKAVGCNDCHTPLAMGPNGPGPDITRMLSGHPADLKMPTPPVVSEPWTMVSSSTNTAFYGPWGISYAANLTPDPTGLGSWNEGMFLKVMKTGQHLGDGRLIQPPMPWPSYGKMSDEDLRAIYAYLRSIPAKANKAPEYTPASQLSAPTP